MTQASIPEDTPSVKSAAPADDTASDTTTATDQPTAAPSANGQPAGGPADAAATSPGPGEPGRTGTSTGAGGNGQAAGQAPVPSKNGAGHVTDNATTISIASVWANRAPELARWAWEHLINRTDVWGSYYISHGPDGPETVSYTAPAVKDRGKVYLSEGVLRRHFAGRSIIGSHSTSAENTSKWGAVDIDWHGDESPDPEILWRAALAWYSRLWLLDLNPLLTDSNGRGGLHLRVLFNGPVPTEIVYAFMNWLVSDYAAFGLPAAPEVFPKQPHIDFGHYGNWLRLPGRHHKRAHWSRVWDGDSGRWLEGHAAIDLLLSHRGVSPDLIPAEALAYREPARARSAAGVVRREDWRAVRGGPLVERARKYIAKMPESVSRDRGHDRCWDVALVLVRGFALPQADAYELMLEFSGRCRPPWSEREIQHKLRTARDNGRVPNGYLLMNGR
jgi:hypothetical protein